MQTVYADQDVTLMSLKPELGKKFGVSNFSSWTLYEVGPRGGKYILRRGKMYEIIDGIIIFLFVEDMIGDDEPLMKRVVQMSDAEINSTKFVWKLKPGEKTVRAFVSPVHVCWLYVKLVACNRGDLVEC